MRILGSLGLKNIMKGWNDGRDGLELLLDFGPWTLVKDGCWMLTGMRVTLHGD